MAVVAVAVTMLAFSFSSFGAYLGDAEVAVVATGNSIRRRLGEVASSAELKLAFKVTSKSKNDDLKPTTHVTMPPTLPLSPGDEIKHQVRAGQRTKDNFTWWDYC